MKRTTYIVMHLPTENYYIFNDMHFNERGLKAYSVAVDKYLATAIPGN